MEQIRTVSPSGSLPLSGKPSTPPSPGSQALPENFQRSEKTYFKLIREFGQICENLKSRKSADASEVLRLSSEIIELIKEDERLLLCLANAPYSFIARKSDGLGVTLVPSHIVIHAVNVMVYAVKISMDVGIFERTLPEIAGAALLSHLGLLSSPDEAGKSGEALFNFRHFAKNAKEYTSSLKLDDKANEINRILDGTLAEPQLNGSRRDEPTEYAMIIQLCSDFETLTHQSKYSPIEAMKKLRDSMNSFFHQDIIKIFFDKLSIYPLGSFVRLSSKETAKIVKINENFIMRPVVLIVLDEEGAVKSNPSRINLREKFNLYIKQPVLDESLTERFLHMF